MNEPNEIVHDLQRMLRSEGDAIGPLVGPFIIPARDPATADLNPDLRTALAWPSALPEGCRSLQSLIRWIPHQTDASAWAIPALIVLTSCARLPVTGFASSMGQEAGCTSPDRSASLSPSFADTRRSSSKAASGHRAAIGTRRRPTADPARSVGPSGQKDRHPARRKSSAATRRTDRRRPPASGRIIPWLL
jgi:hypothetical protein